MPHLSDGELHAYLDGALELLPGGRAEEIREHLRACEACRSRLADERELVERSAAILDAGAPAEAEAPPLEELRERARIREERAGEERSRRWRAMPRSQVVAWAATVVLALGIGWVTRDLTGVRSPLGRSPVESSSISAPADTVPPEEGSALSGARDGDGRSTAAGDADADRLGDSPPPGDAEESGRGAATREAGPNRIAPAAAPRQEEGGTPERPAGEPVAEVQLGEPVADAQAEERVTEARAGEREEAGSVPGPTVVGRVVDAESLEPLASAQVVLEDSAGVHHAGVLTRSDGRFELRAARPGTYRAVVELLGYGGARTDFFELSPDDTVAREIRAPARAVTLDAITVTGAVAEESEAPQEGRVRTVPESAAAVAADRTAAAEREGGRVGSGGAREAMAPRPVPESSHVPGLPVVRIDPQTEPAGFVIEQRLPDGGTLHLRWVAGFALDADEVAAASPFPEPLPDGWSEVVVRRGDGWLVARAPLEEADLRALLSRSR